MLSIRLPDATDARLERVARAVGLTKTALAREAIMARLDELEDRYLALARARKNHRSIPLEEVERVLGLVS